MGLSSGTAGWIAIGAAVAAAIVAVLVLLVWLEGRRARAPRPSLLGTGGGERRDPLRLAVTLPRRGRALAGGATGGRARHGAQNVEEAGLPPRSPRWKRACLWEGFTAETAVSPVVIFPRGAAGSRPECQLRATERVLGSACARARLQGQGRDLPVARPA